MTNLAKLEFMALDITGKNYLSWVLDAEIHLNANNLGDTIKEGNKASTQDKAKAMIFLRHHIHEALKSEYLTIKDPLVLWTNLKERYDHQKTVILPRARYEWINLRLQDFKSISEYNSAMFRITSQLILCGENITDKEMLEKTFLTFHPSNVILQQQYRERGFTKYSELISCLLVAEQNNELLMKNHETRPIGATPIPEADVATYDGQSESYGRGRGYHRGRGRVMAVVVVMVVDVAEEIIIVFSLKTKGPTKSGIIMKINPMMKKIKGRWDLHRMHVTDVEVTIIGRRLVIRPNTWWNFINNPSKTKQKK
ncbi:hypothetical protein HanIR_Chr15g0742771 [Helianthus annuus]|nr:hypothetical protein HanIR_Chr15g0742771 [Helianthus annuus]